MGGANFLQNRCLAGSGVFFFCFCFFFMDRETVSIRNLHLPQFGRLMNRTPFVAHVLVLPRKHSFSCRKSLKALSSEFHPEDPGPIFLKGKRSKMMGNSSQVLSYSSSQLSFCFSVAALFYCIFSPGDYV